MASRKVPPISDLDGPGILPSRPLTVIECVLLLLIVTAPLLVSLGHDWYDARFNPVVRQAIAEAKAMREANAELTRLILLEQSKVAAMREQVGK
jgi:hypothetical protein